MNTSLALKATGVLVALVAWFGFILPYMVSATDSLMVLTGFVVTAFGVFSSVITVGREFIAAYKRHGKLK